jgi:hypothetical protein
MRVSEYKFVETDGKGWYAPIFDAAGHLVPAQEVLDRLNDNAALRADVQAAREMLGFDMYEFQTAGFDEQVSVCRSCNREEGKGHEDDCERAKLQRRLERWA